MENKYNMDDLFKELDLNLKKRPSDELLHRIEQFANRQVKQIEKFTIGQILSIAASFLLLALVNFSILKTELVNETSVEEQMVSYDFIPVNSLYNE